MFVSCLHIKNITLSKKFINNSKIKNYNLKNKTINSPFLLIYNTGKPTSTTFPRYIWIQTFVKHKKKLKTKLFSLSLVCPLRGSDLYVRLLLLFLNVWLSWWCHITLLYVFVSLCLLYTVLCIFLNKNIVSNFIFNHNKNDDNGGKRF